MGVIHSFSFGGGVQSTAALVLDEVERLRNTNLPVAEPLCDGGDDA